MRRRVTRWRSLVLLLTMTLSLASIAAAQMWRGRATLGVTVRSGKGTPIQSALVTIAYRDVGFGDGPGARQTNSAGEANFTGISPGNWSLKIDHPDYLSYLATIIVREGKKPQILTEFLEATGSGRLTMRVKPLKGIKEERGTPIRSASESPQQPAIAAGSPLSGPVPPPPEASPTQPRETASVPSSEPGAPDPVEVEPEEPTATGQSRPVTATPQAQPQPDSEAVAEKPANDAAEGYAQEDPEPTDPQLPVAESPAPEPASEGPGTERPAEPAPLEAKTEAPPEPSFPQTEEPLPQAVPQPDSDPGGLEATPAQPAPEEVAEPAPESTPIPLPEPSKPVGVPDPDPAIAGPAAQIPPPASGTKSLPTPRELTQELPIEASPPSTDRATLRSYKNRTCFECKPGEWSVASTVEVEGVDASPCTSISEGQLREHMEALVDREADRFAEYAGPLNATTETLPLELSKLASGSCRIVAVVLPKDSRFAGFRFQAADDRGDGDCLGVKECSIGSARWLFNPGIARSESATVVFSVFQNSAVGKERRATLIAYFVPSARWISGL